MLTVLALTSAFAQAPTLLTTVQTASPTCDPDPDPTSDPVDTSEPPCGGSAVYLPDGQTANSPDTSLVVYLPGSSMVPQDHAHVVKMAAQAGYPTIGLSYESSRTTGFLCETATDCSDCMDRVRQERILGTDHTSSLGLTLPPEVEVLESWHDAVIPRLWEAIDAAAAADTGGLVDWELYYNPCKTHPRPRPADIYWENIILSGFSQGGGMGLYISQIERVDGLVLTEGGNDVCPVDPTNPAGPQEAADWYIPGGGASNGVPRFAFGHRRNGPLTMEVPPGLQDAGFVLGDDVDTVGWALTTDHVANTDQLYAPGDPTMAKACGAHLSMGRSDCMPTDATSGIGAAVPSAAHLAEPYVEAFELAGQ